MLLKNPKQKLNLKYLRALEIAKENNNKAVIKLLSEYVETHQIKEDGVTIIGSADLKETLSLLNKDNPLSFLKSLSGIQNKVKPQAPIENDISVQVTPNKRK